jgi:hypothetical protein
VSARCCEWCGEELTSTSPRARYCDSTCRSRASRARSAGAEEIPEEPPAKKRAAKKSTKSNATPEDGEHAFVTATRKELVDLAAADTMLGHQVITIAERMGRGAETGAAMASLSKEHSRLIAEIRARAKGTEEDPVEAARRARDEKAARASQG